MLSRDEAIILFRKADEDETGAQRASRPVILTALNHAAIS